MASPLWAWISVARMVVGRSPSPKSSPAARPGVESLKHPRFRSLTGVSGRPGRRGAGGLEHRRADPPRSAGHAGRRALDVLCEPAVATGTLNLTTALDAVGNDPLLGGAA
jgi:hypothetical protein